MPRMELVLVGCTGLPNTETFGKIDPYCTVQFEGKTWKTEECEDTTEPQWNKTFKFNIADENSSQAHICVWNKNTVSDDFLGDYWLSVSGLDRGKADDRSVLLTKCKGNAELHLIVTAVDFGDVDEAEPESAQTTYQQRPPMEGYAPPPGAAINAPYPPQQQQGYPPQQQQQQGYPPQQQQAPPQQHHQQPPPQQHHQQAPPQQQQGYPSQQAASGRVVLGSFHGNNNLSANPEGQMSLSPNSQGWEQFTMENHGGEVVFRSAHNTYLSADPNAAASLAPHAQGWEKWVVTPHPSEQGRMAIRSAHNTFLRVSPDGKVDLSPHAQGWEAWTIRNV